MKSNEWRRWIKEEVLLCGCAIFGFSFIVGIVVVMVRPDSGLSFKKSQGFAKAKYQSRHNGRAGTTEFVRFDAMQCMSGPWNTCLPDNLQTF
jgi:hypothetical protein